VLGARGHPFPTTDLKPEEVNRSEMKNATNVKALAPGRIRNIVREAVDRQVWGIASSVDIYDCEPDKIRDADFIRKFVAELCDLIEMKRFGETQVVHFGEDERVAGYSMVQLIETSLISAHFANQTNTTYLDVFSCKPYDPETVRRFAKISFGGSRSQLNVTLRR
jgi:S-adenosylmethionine/arginine decarboxylase-like enzyme